MSSSHGKQGTVQVPANTGLAGRMLPCRMSAPHPRTRSRCSAAAAASARCSCCRRSCSCRCCCCRAAALPLLLALRRGRVPPPPASFDSSGRSGSSQAGSCRPLSLCPSLFHSTAPASSPAVSAMLTRPQFGAGGCAAGGSRLCASWCSGGARPLSRLALSTRMRLRPTSCGVARWRQDQGLGWLHESVAQGGSKDGPGEQRGITPQLPTSVQVMAASDGADGPKMGLAAVAVKHDITLSAGASASARAAAAVAAGAGARRNSPGGGRCCGASASSPAPPAAAPGALGGRWH